MLIAVAIRRTFLRSFILLLVCGAAHALRAQTTPGQWDEVVGKTLKTHQGDRLGTITDSVIDLEHGRVVGVIVPYGGFLGIGRKSIIIPTRALRKDGTPRTMFLDMDKKTFSKAPTFDFSRLSGRPLIEKTSAVYRYFGQIPAFATDEGRGTSTGGKQLPLGYLRKGSKVLQMEVENLQGVPLGVVAGLRGINWDTGELKGVVIRPFEGQNRRVDMNVVEPQALRYNLKNNRLRLNKDAQPFKDSPTFTMSQGGRFEEESPIRPGVPRPPLVHGQSARDKAITRRISQHVMNDNDLSIYGDNIDIATINGKTILRGRVVDAQARDRIVAYAVKEAGSGNVSNQIVIEAMTGAERSIDRN